MKVAILTWQGGGATQPAFGIGRILAERGHEVRVVGPAAYAERAETAGCSLSPLPAELEFDPGRGRAAEEQAGYIAEIMLGEGPPRALAAELEREPVDLVVIDYLMRSAISRAESLGVPTVVLFHTVHRFHGVPRGGEEEWGWRWQYSRLNRLRESFGLESPPVGPETTTVALARRVAAALVAMPAEFDVWAEQPPPNLTHVGPIFEERGAPAWDSPWAEDDDRPLVVVSMGSTYMHQEDLLTRVAGVLAEVGMRVLVLTGAELGADELSLGPDVVVRDFVPHLAVFPQADLVVTHAGMGTLMAACAAGVPVLCLPLGRDQNLNAGLVEELGLGVVLAAEAPAEQIREAAQSILASPDFHAAVEEMKATIAGYDTEAEIARIAEAAVRARG